MPLASSVAMSRQNDRRRMSNECAADLSRTSGWSTRTVTSGSARQSMLTRSRISSGSSTGAFSRMGGTALCRRTTVVIKTHRRPTGGTRPATFNDRGGCSFSPMTSADGPHLRVRPTPCGVSLPNLMPPGGRPRSRLPAHASRRRKGARPQLPAPPRPTNLRGTTASSRPLASPDRPPRLSLPRSRRGTCGSPCQTCPAEMRARPARYPGARWRPASRRSSS